MKKICLKFEVLKRLPKRTPLKALLEVHGVFQFFLFFFCERRCSEQTTGCSADGVVCPCLWCALPGLLTAPTLLWCFSLAV